MVPEQTKSKSRLNLESLLGLSVDKIVHDNHVPTTVTIVMFKIFDGSRNKFCHDLVDDWDLLLKVVGSQASIPVNLRPLFIGGTKTW